MIVILFLLGLFVLCFILYNVITRWKMFDNFVKEISDEDYVAPERSAKKVIKEVEGIKDDLQKKAEKNRKTAEQLEQESSTIDDYLGSDKNVKTEGK